MPDTAADLPIDEFPDAPASPRTSAAEGKSSLLDGLTPPQIEAATHVDGPLLVLAGPGSGKTRVITRRIGYLVLEVGIAPWNVLAITFTNKAAGEMQARVAELVSEGQARAATVATFHSLCARLLRRYADRVDLPAGYSIYDSADQKSAMKRVLDDLEINPKNFPPQQMLSTISNAKNELIGAEAYARDASDFYARTVAKVYTKYDQTLRRNQAVDFDDLLLKTVGLLRDHPDVLEELQDRYQYILIDEYQDTNHAQFMLANVLAAKHKNICATGDPDQSIYGWRGANIRNILDFEHHYPNAKVVRLERNYRSTRRILAAADALIRHNKGRKHKELFSDLGEGEHVRLVTCDDERAEARTIVEHFTALNRDEGVNWAEMAVFYRMNSLSRVMEDALRDAGVPYQIARGTAFYDRAEIKNAIAYLRTIVNPADEVSLTRIINTPSRGISDRTVKAMQAFALAKDMSIDQVVADPTAIESLNTRAQNSVTRFAEMVAAWRDEAGLEGTLGQVGEEPAKTGEPGGGSEHDQQRAMAFAPEVETEKETTAGEPLDANAAADADATPGPGPGPTFESSLRHFVEDVLRESGLEDYYENDKSDPEKQRLANLGEFVTFAQQFEAEYDDEAEQEGRDTPPGLTEKLLQFLERISLITDVDAVDSDEGAVTLMTLHAAKGLEFHAVAMIGVEDGVLPHKRSRDSDEEMEEERRLCFVGVTRAMRRLWLTRAARRTMFGQTTPTFPSPFLTELPEDVVEEQNVVGDDEFDPARGRRQRSAASRQADQYAPGTLVRHEQFGLGRVLRVDAVGAHSKARVEFNTAGAKTLILQYAKLEPVQTNRINDADGAV